MFKHKRGDDEQVDQDDAGNTVQAAENCLYINGAITSDTVAPAIGFIIGANAAEEFGDIFLFINSGGGNLYEGFALANVISSSRIPITTVALGECDSAALIIAMAGHRRLVMQDTSILSHQYSAGIGLSKHGDIQARVKDFELTASKVVRHYCACTGLSEQKVRADLVKETDVFLSPEEAVGFGLFDEILTDFAQVFVWEEDEMED